jgi:DNA-binding transcriptional ArsR family regulator
MSSISVRDPTIIYADRHRSLPPTFREWDTGFSPERPSLVRQQLSESAQALANPAVARLATIRNVTDRTIQRHVDELVDAGLLTKEERSGDTNILYIEDVSREEEERYAKTYVRGENNVTPPR